MIISHKHKFIFIKTKKTAGTSLEIFLSNICGLDDIVTPFSNPEEGHEPRNFKGIINPFVKSKNASYKELKSSFKDFLSSKKFYNHISAELVRSRVPKNIWNSYFKFAVDRNPYDKTISHFSMRKALGKCESLDDYFNQKDFCLNMPYYCDSGGSLMVDKLLKYESLDSELQDVLNQLSINETVSLVRAKGHYRKSHSLKSTQSFFNSDQIALINEYFKDEFALNQYKMES